MGATWLIKCFDVVFLEKWCLYFTEDVLSDFLFTTSKRDYFASHTISFDDSSNFQYVLKPFQTSENVPKMPGRDINKAKNCQNHSQCNRYLVTDV